MADYLPDLSTMDQDQLSAREPNTRASALATCLPLCADCLPAVRLERFSTISAHSDLSFSGTDGPAIGVGGWVGIGSGGAALIALLVYCYRRRSNAAGVYQAHVPLVDA